VRGQLAMMKRSAEFATAIGPIDLAINCLTKNTTGSFG